MRQIYPDHEIVHDTDITNSCKLTGNLLSFNQISRTIMSTRRSKVIGSLKHVEYLPGKKGVFKGKIVFPAQTSSSKNNSRSASPEKAYQTVTDRNQDLYETLHTGGDITFMDAESILDTGMRVKQIFI